VFEEELRTRIGSAVPERSLRQFYATLVKLRSANLDAEERSSA